MVWKSLLKAAAVPVSAACYAVAFPPVEVYWLMPVSLLLLFWALSEVPPALALMGGFVHGLIAYGIGVSWFWNLFGPLALALMGILAAFHALYGLFSASIKTRLGCHWTLPLVLAGLWTFIEFTRGELFWLKFPWFGVGLSRGPHWLLPWLGVYGVTFLTAYGIHAALLKQTRRIAIPCLIAWALPSYFTKSLEPEETAVPITAVQAEMAGLKTYLKLSAEAPAETRLWIWPEYAYASDLSRNPRDYESVLAFLKSKPDAILVLGTHTWVGEEGWHNTALTLGPEGKLGSHFKNHTVHLFDDGIPGTEAKPVATPLGLIGTPVCFDCDFQDVIRRMTSAGADFIVAPTMDALSWSLRQHEQHARLFQIRAAENRRWIAVAATSGVTQIIDHHGQVTARLPLVKEAALSGLLHTRADLTFFTRYGFLFPWLLPALILVPLLRRHISRAP